MVIKYQTKGMKILTPCPFNFGFISHNNWNIGAPNAVMVGSGICILDCPYNGGYDTKKQIVHCNCNHDDKQISNNRTDQRRK